MKYSGRSVFYVVLARDYNITEIEIRGQIFSPRAVNRYAFTVALRSSLFHPTAMPRSEATVDLIAT